MWDEPQQLNRLTKLLLSFAFALLLLVAARYVLRLPIFPLQSGTLKSAPVQVTREEIEQAVQASVRGNFFAVNLGQTRAAFEQLPWVRKVSVRRKFPWGLEIELEEHVAMARWNGNAFVNTFGEVFMDQVTAITAPPNVASMPIFLGQPENSKEIALRYAELQTLLQPIKQDIGQISLSPRFAWQVELSNGMALELGREQLQQRLTRFVTVYPYSLAAWDGVVKHVDLRYRNGFAAYLPNGLVAKRSSDKKVER